jgi:hypothetical protein
MMMNDQVFFNFTNEIIYLPFLKGLRKVLSNIFSPPFDDKLPAY